MIPIILSGGAGTRLWPLSRALYPKQFLSLNSNKTLFQETLCRLKKLEMADPIIVCNEEHRFIVAENIHNIGDRAQNIILEPVGRNTAPAIAAAALFAIENNDDPLLMVLPSDHIIEDIEAFCAATTLAKELAEKGHMVTFGIKPTKAHSGYGYIEQGEAIAENANKIAAFKEKPDIKTAQSFIESGKYFWNSGMFCFKASNYLEELEKHQPDLLKHVKDSVSNSKNDLDFNRLNKDAFEQCSDISIDYAVMEHTNNGVVVGLDANWMDIGSWDSVWEIADKDVNGNVCKGDIITQDSKNNYVYSKDKLVAILGAENLIIIDTQDALLVADKSKAQDVKTIVSKLKKDSRAEATHHKTVYRPWGHYTPISEGLRYQTKHISVKSGGKISLQKHQHRSEHWIIVRGTAKVIKGDETFILTENESVYLPIGVVHSLENIDDTVLEVIEVQTGDYLSEDDIIRLEDIYGRV